MQKSGRQKRIRQSLKRLSKNSSPSLSWAVHRDLAHLLSGWRDYVKKLGRDAFGLLLILEAVRLHVRDVDTFRYRELEETLSISPATLRRWLRTLKTAGLVTTEPVPGSNRAEAAFQIHLEAPRKRRRTSALTSERTRRSRRRH